MLWLAVDDVGGDIGWEAVPWGRCAIGLTDGSVDGAPALLVVGVAGRVSASDSPSVAVAYSEQDSAARLARPDGSGDRTPPGQGRTV